MKKEMLLKKIGMTEETTVSDKDWDIRVEEVLNKLPKNVSKMNRLKLKKLLNEYRDVFDGGKWTCWKSELCGTSY